MSNVIYILEAKKRLEKSRKESTRSKYLTEKVKHDYDYFNRRTNQTRFKNELRILS